MSQAVLDRPIPRVAVRPTQPRYAVTPSIRVAAPAHPFAAAALKAGATYALVAGLMAAIQWPVIMASDVPTRLGVALQIAMTATCVAGWFSLILIFDRFIGDQH